LLDKTQRHEASRAVQDYRHYIL